MDSSRINALKLHFMNVARRVCPGFTVTDGLRDTVAAIFRWCVMADGPLDPAKGLWLCGDIGTGKSTMLQIVKAFCRDVRPRDEEGERYGFAIFNAERICGDFAEKGFGGLEPYLKSRRLAIDELGRETLSSGHYGNTLNVMQHLLQSRYDNRYTHFTHVTTNLGDAQVKTLYGAHIFDRRREMFNTVEFRGNSFRKPKL